MKTKNIVIVLFVALGVALVATKWFSHDDSAREARTEASQPDAAKEPIKNTTPDDPTNRSEQEVGWSVFSTPGEDDLARMNHWLGSTFIESVDGAEYHLRSRIVMLNPFEFKNRSFASFDTNRRQLETTKSQTDLLLSLFPDDSYRAKVTWYSVGRNSGVTIVNGSLIGQGFSGRERVYFEVTESGGIRGSVITDDKTYRVYPGPTQLTAVIVEFDSEAMRASKRVD